jgi:hypothetical protein
VVAVGAKFRDDAPDPLICWVPVGRGPQLGDLRGLERMEGLRCVADATARALPEMAQLRVAHAAGAVERMLVTRPLVVVVDESISVVDFERIAECARDIRAEILRASTPLRANLEASLRSAILGAERARADQP